MLWALVAKQEDISISLFFLICMVVTGVYGAATVKLSILWVQALPATIALLLLVLRQRAEKLDQLVFNR